VRNNIFAFGRNHQIQRTRPARELSFAFEQYIVYWTDGPPLSALSIISASRGHDGSQ
jgi:hypothetical protein